MLFAPLLRLSAGETRMADSPQGKHEPARDERPIIPAAEFSAAENDT
jgi:hypothetical protein